jgi:hypothetical protein
MRLSEDYSDEAHQSAIAAAIEFSKTLQETESQFDMTAWIVMTMTMDVFRTLQGP